MVTLQEKQSTEEDSLPCARPLTEACVHMLSGPDFSPFVLNFPFFFFLLHFSILDNTPRIDIKQK